MLIDDLAHIRGWVFDLDGTLTQPVLDFTAIRNELGIPQHADILGFIATQPEPHKAALNKKLYELELYYAGLAKPAEGAHALISFLASSTKCLGILTRNDRQIALTTLEAIGLRHYFDERFILGRDEAEPKPSGQGIEMLCTQWDISPTQSVMVGDYIHDLGAGRAVGAMTINYHPTPDVSWREHTDLHVASLHQLLKAKAKI